MATWGHFSTAGALGCVGATSNRREQQWTKTLFVSVMNSKAWPGGSRQRVASQCPTLRANDGTQL
jgi:hypothetical protein